MKKLCLVAVILLLVAACQDRPNVNDIEIKLEQKKSIETKLKTQSSTENALKALDQTLSVNRTLNAKEIKFETIAYQYDLPEEMKRLCDINNQQANIKTEIPIIHCVDIDIKLTKIDPIWIERIVNKTITNDDGLNLLKFKKTINEFVDEYLVQIRELRAESQYADILSYSWSIEPKLLPSFNNIAQIVIDSNTYMGGAHDLPQSTYLIFDMDLQSQIILDDIIVANKEEEFYQLAYSAFKDYLKNELKLTTKRKIQEYEQIWKFELPENFYFDKDGLILVYQPYEMGSFAQGFIELTIPYEKLQEKGVLKSPYFPKMPELVVE